MQKLKVIFRYSGGIRKCLLLEQARRCVQIKSGHYGIIIIRGEQDLLVQKSSRQAFGRQTERERNDVERAASLRIQTFESKASF